MTTTKDMGLRVEMEPTAALVPYARNAKRHTREQVRQIANSIEEFGFADPVGVWTNADGESEIVEGHGRVLAARLLGVEEVPVIHLDALTDEQRRAYALAHNQLTMSTGWDAEALGLELDGLSELFDMGDFGLGSIAFGETGPAGQQDGEAAPSRLADDFLVPPFTVMSARAGAWQDRKRQWLDLGIESELGRGGGSCLQHGGLPAVPSGRPLPLNRKKP